MYDNSVEGVISPKSDIRRYVSGTPLTISWKLIEPPRSGNFTVSVSGTLLADSFSPDSTTWVTPSVPTGRGYDIKFELWDGIPFKSTSYNPRQETIAVQPIPWTHDRLSVISPLAGEHIGAGSTYRVKWNWLGRGTTRTENYIVYLCVSMGGDYQCYNAPGSVNYDWGSRTMYKDIDIPLSARHFPSYIQFQTDEFCTFNLLDETKRHITID